MYISIISEKINPIPPEIGQLEELRQIILSFVTEELIFPKELIKLEKLYSFAYVYSDLDTIPPIIYDLKSLTNLSFFDCKIKYLSKKVNQLQKLESLNLHNNKIEDLPISILDMPKLTHLQLQNNKLSFEDIEPLMSKDFLTLKYSHKTAFIKMNVILLPLVKH